MKANIAGKCIRLIAENENDVAYLRSWAHKAFNAGYVTSRRPYNNWPELYLTEVKERAPKKGELSSR